jgi:hypothetical protein
VSSARVLARLGTVAWYALVALPVRPPWQRDRQPRAHPPARRAVARLLVAGLLLVTLTGGAEASAGTVMRLLVALRNLPVAALAVPWGIAHGATPGVRGGLVVLTGMEDGHGARRTVTLGSVVLTERSRPQLNAHYLTHERRHSEQWAVFGPVGFPAAYGLAEVVAGPWFGGHGHGNVFEIAAGLLEGGYDVRYDAPAARVAARWLAPEVPRPWRCRYPGSLRRVGKTGPVGPRGTRALPDVRSVVVLPTSDRPGAPGHVRRGLRHRSGAGGRTRPTHARGPAGSRMTHLNRTRGGPVTRSGATPGRHRSRHPGTGGEVLG